MKKIKLITYIFLILFVLDTSAQEKQNDATIDETINWINEHAVASMVNLNSDQLTKPSYFEINEGAIKYLYFDHALTGFDFKLEKDITTRLRIIKSPHGEFTISFNRVTGQKEQYNWAVNNLTNVFSFGTNKENALRCYKAFEHLFYLLEWKVECVNKLVDENRF